MGLGHAYLKAHPLVVALIGLAVFAIPTALVQMYLPQPPWPRDIGGLTAAAILGLVYWVYHKPHGQAAAPTPASSAGAARPAPPQGRSFLIGLAVVGATIVLLVLFVPRGIWSMAIMGGVIAVTLAVFQYLYRRPAALEPAK
jgi:hypothetical protein